MTDKEKLNAIRAEIHRLVDVRGYDREMANDLFAFMDSLPNEPVSEDLEVELTSYMENSFTSVEEPDEFLTTVMQKDDLLAFARHFTNWQKEQMIKDAVEGMVEEPESLWWRIISDDLEGEFVVKNNLHDEDRVKMIIIKEG